MFHFTARTSLLDRHFTVYYKQTLNSISELLDPRRPILYCVPLCLDALTFFQAGVYHVSFNRFMRITLVLLCIATTRGFRVWRQENIISWLALMDAGNPERVCIWSAVCIPVERSNVPVVQHLTLSVRIPGNSLVRGTEMSCYYYTRVWLVVTLEFLFSLRAVSFSQNNLHSEHQLRAPMATLNRTLTSFRLTNGTEAMASTTKICFLLAVMHSILASSSAFLSVSGPQRPQRVRILFIPANSAD